MAEHGADEGAELSAAGASNLGTAGLEVEVEGGRVTVVITRQPRGILPLDELAREVVTCIGEGLPRFKDSPPRHWTLQGARAVSVEMTWASDTGPKFQKLALVEVDTAVLSVTAIGAEDLRPHVTRVLDEACSRLRIAPPARILP